MPPRAATAGNDNHSNASQQRTRAPSTPSLSRLPKHSSTLSPAPPSPAPRNRRSSLASPSPTLTPGATSTSPSYGYFSPQSAASGTEPRSPAARRPPASFSGHGIDNSRGPPITLITRGTVDVGRRSQKPNDFAFAQQQLLQLGLVSPGATSQSSGGQRRRRDSSASSADYTPQQTPGVSRQNSTRKSKTQRHMDSSVDGSSEYGSALHSQSEDTRPKNSRRGVSASSGSGEEQGEDLFMNIAEDSSKASASDAASRGDRVRSRIARSSNRQSLPTNAFSSASTTPNASRLPPSIDTKSGLQSRRNLQFPLSTSTPRAQREQSPLTPANPLETARSRFPLDVSSKSSSPRPKEQEPTQYISQFGRRRPSYPDTPPSRTQTYRPSNLHYSSSRDAHETSHLDASQETGSRADGTDSIDSTGPAASVWDELDELKNRIRKIELGGKIPATSAAVVSNASGERPRTANTSVTTASSSPQNQRKPRDVSPDKDDGTSQAPKVHPLLREALKKAKMTISPTVYRVLEATAAEALELAEMTGSAGPQGTLISASSIINGATVPDRHVRRKADNICRSLTELCISLTGTNTNVQSPAMRSAVATSSRRPSVQINGESPSIRTSIETDDIEPPRSSPSRAMSRIEARRNSLMINSNSREASLEPPTPSQSHIPSRLGRAGTSLLRTRRAGDDEDEDPTLRAPSRAMTDFREVRATNNTKRFSREYTSREPMPELQPSPALQHTSSLRRPTVSGVANESNLLFRDTNRRYNVDRHSSPAYEKQGPIEYSGRSTQPLTQFSSNRASLGASSLGRTGSLSRRLRGNAAGE